MITRRLSQMLIGAVIGGVLIFSAACSTVIGKMAEAQLNYQSAHPAVAPIRERAAGNEEMLFWTNILESSMGDFQSIQGEPVSREDRERLVARAKESLGASVRQNENLRSVSGGATNTQRSYLSILKHFEKTKYYNSTVSLPKADSSYIQYTPPGILVGANLQKSVGFNVTIPVDSVQESVEVANHFAGVFKRMYEGQDGWKIFDAAAQRSQALTALQSMEKYSQTITDPEVRRTHESTKELHRKRASMENVQSQTFTYQWVDGDSPVMVSHQANVKLPYQIVFTVNNMMIADADPATGHTATYPEVAISVLKVTPLKSDLSQ